MQCSRTEQQDVENLVHLTFFLIAEETLPPPPPPFLPTGVFYIVL